MGTFNLKMLGEIRPDLAPRALNRSGSLRKPNKNFQSVISSEKHFIRNSIKHLPFMFCRINDIRQHTDVNFISRARHNQDHGVT